MTDIEKAEQAWNLKMVKRISEATYLVGESNLHSFSYTHGYKMHAEDFKSSLQREIEKRIEELEQLALVSDRWHSIDIQIAECRRFIKSLNTVEP